MGKRREADDPNDIIQGKRKRTISSRVKESVTATAKNVAKKVTEAVKKGSRSSKKSTKSALTSDSSSDDSSRSSRSSRTSSRPAKRIRPTVQSEKDDEANFIPGVDEVIDIDANGDLHNSRTPSSCGASPDPSGSANGEGLAKETDEQELGQSTISE